MRILAITLALLTANVLRAQETVGQIPPSVPAERGDVVISLAAMAQDATYDFQYSGGSAVSAGAGVLLETKVNDRWGLETGVLYMGRVYRVNGAGGSLVEKTRRVHIPAAAKFWISDMLSVSAGPYVGVKTGDVSTREDSLLDRSRRTNAHLGTEVGADLAATFIVPVQDTTSLFVEGRYSTPFDIPSGEESGQISLLAGMKLDVGT